MTDPWSLSSFLIHLSDTTKRLRYMLLSILLVSAAIFALYVRSAEISSWTSGLWTSEDIGLRLRRECASIIREAEPDAGAQYTKTLVRGCVLQRGLKSP